VKPVELTTDCDACLLEAGVVEIYDPLVAACRFGLPARAECRLCSHLRIGAFSAECKRSLADIPANRCPACETELGPEAVDSRACATCSASASLVEERAPARFDSPATFEAALDAWAKREGFSDRHALVHATFVVREEELYARVAAKQPLEIVADPFANMGVRTSRGAAKPETGKPADNPGTAVAGPLAGRAPKNAPPNAGFAIVLGPPSSAPPASAPPRAIVFPLVSVIAADGEIHPEERALISRFLESEGLPPLTEDEFKVHSPAAVARYVPKARREDVIKLMCESACVDGAPDESEKRVIRAYAAAWGVDDEKVDFWLWGYESMNTSLPRQLFLRLRRFILSARWSPDTLDGDE
jgi:uncharacterized tellurite resistance protein B-like protein